MGLKRVSWRYYDENIFPLRYACGGVLSPSWWRYVGAADLRGIEVDEEAARAALAVEYLERAP